ncbi:MAG TPA: hypothetical protein VLD18_15485, partial [Verrucomicrobiae bacterium]|nr:hypothetical protein [Verrucomicrobiae bacterium]
DKPDRDQKFPAVFQTEPGGYPFGARASEPADAFKNRIRRRSRPEGTFGNNSLLATHLGLGYVRNRRQLRLPETACGKTPQGSTSGK